YYRGTKVKCTKPELLFTGSTFNNRWKDLILNVKDEVTEYYCRKEYLNCSLSELSKEHPEVIFSGTTWIADDYESAIDYTFILKDGSFEFIKRSPHYQILFPVIKDEEYNRLSIKFCEQIYQYLNRIDLVNEDADSTFDFLNDKEDEEGFKSYFTITWENKDHKFIATKRHISFVAVDYQRKNKKNNHCETDFEYIPDYEIGIEHNLLPKEDWAYEEHLVLCVNDNDDLYFENDEYFNEIIDKYYYEVFDLGDVECLSEDDLFQNTWLVAGKEFSNYIDYFWDAEITDLFQNEDRDFYTKYRNGFSEDIWENYSKYRCMEGDSGFIFCNKESCEGCNHVNTKKVINPHYGLWEKYVKPLILA
ncbi:MAG: hypothetical protein WD577_07880, partial [Bacteroidales bacterium]